VFCGDSILSLIIYLLARDIAVIVILKKAKLLCRVNGRRTFFDRKFEGFLSDSHGKSAGDTYVVAIA